MTKEHQDEEASGRCSAWERSIRTKKFLEGGSEEAKKTAQDSWTMSWKDWIRRRTHNETKEMGYEDGWKAKTRSNYLRVGS